MHDHLTEQDRRKLLDPLANPTLPVEIAGRIFGLGRSAAYDAARRGQLPTLRFGRQLRVPTAALLKMLDLDPAGHPPAEG